ncbi:MAG: O-antigen ligase family protein [Verrucomicrobia bacterium]|nr:O-antigen ligase family protein [Verrucomicrobiota bacterium]
MDLIRRACSRENLILLLVALAMFLLPIDHKNDKAFRFFSRTLIPEGLNVPDFFDKKIYFYIGDLIGLALLFLIPWKRLDWAVGLLGVVFGCWIVSVANSSFGGYPIVYLRCLQGLIPFAFFAAIGYSKSSELILKVLIAAALIQSVIAIGQYVNQGSLGLRVLNEQRFDNSMPGTSSILVPGGKRWLFDGAHATDEVVRSLGTMPHPNVLGGFLFVAIMASIYFFSKGAKWAVFPIFVQVAALATTYSRSAIFALCLGMVSWAVLQRRVRELAVVGVAVLICGALFSEQYLHRGGIVNSTKISESSNAIRRDYQEVAWNMIQEHPVAGVGHGLFLVKVAEKGLPTFSVHNIFTLIAAESGLVALGAFLAWIGWLFYHFLRSEKGPLAIVLFSIFGGLLFIGLCDFYPWTVYHGKMVFFLAAGLLYSQRTLNVRNP